MGFKEYKNKVVANAQKRVLAHPVVRMAKAVKAQADDTEAKRQASQQAASEWARSQEEK